MALATADADAVPRSLSGAATTRTPPCSLVCRPQVPLDTVGPPMAAAPPDRPIVLVSNRGPVSFERADDGTLTSKRGAGGLVSGIGPIAAEGDVTWLAAAMSDDDRAAASDGVVEADGFRVRLLDLDPEAYRLAYEVVSNEVLWFAHHGLVGPHPRAGLRHVAGPTRGTPIER